LVVGRKMLTFYIRNKCDNYVVMRTKNGMLYYFSSKIGIKLIIRHLGELKQRRHFPYDEAFLYNIVIYRLQLLFNILKVDKKHISCENL
jgi:hypothetical protein